MSIPILESTIAMKHDRKLMKKIFEELNKDNKILSLEDFESIVACNTRSEEKRGTRVLQTAK